MKQMNRYWTQNMISLCLIIFLIKLLIYIIILKINNYKNQMF